jgi:hypothetical protein
MGGLSVWFESRNGIRFYRAKKEKLDDGIPRRNFPFLWSMVRSPIDESLESERKEEEFEILYLVQYAIECCGTEPDFTRLRKNVG